MSKKFPTSSESQKQYRLCVAGDSRADVLGGCVTGENCYIAAYPKIEKGSKMPRDLEVGEHSVATYNLGGTKGTYWIVRIS